MNRSTHQLVAGATVGTYMARRESMTGTTTIKPLLGGAAAAILRIFQTFSNQLLPRITVRFSIVLLSTFSLGRVCIN